MLPPEFPALVSPCPPWLAPEELASTKQLLPGCGAIMRRGGARLAVFRDLDGGVLERSAMCPHCGSPVEWNAMDRTWDCVGHGMRFDPTGAARNGPDGRPMNPAP